MRTTSNQNELGVAGSSALHSMEDKIDQLPLLPQVLVKMLQLRPENDDYFDRLAELAKVEPAFAVRIVATANSVSSSPISPITSIESALTRIGADAIRNLVTSLAVQRVFMPTEKHQVQLWVHSVTAAVCCHKLAKLLPHLEIDAGLAYLAGLLHDVGRFVMYEHASPELLKVDESHWHSPEELIEADIEIFKYTHSELGYLACKHWGLPDDIGVSIRYHHSDLPEKIVPGSNYAVTFCIQFADHLCLSVLQCSDFKELSEEERISRITEHCPQLKQSESMLAADELNNVLDNIHDESAQFLSGLGFAM